MFLETNIVVVIFFRTGLDAFPYSNYKTLSKFTEAWQYSNIVYMSDGFAYTEFQLPIKLCI